MKISIITACRNAVKTLPTTLESVRRQRGEGFELEYIVVDGGSTDGTLELIKGFSPPPPPTPPPPTPSTFFSYRWISEKDRGLYDAINKGIGMATGDVVGILNADDVFATDDVVARIADAFGAGTDGELDCVYAKVYFVGSQAPGLAELREARAVRRCFAQLWRPWMLQWGYMPPHPGVFIRRECFEKWGKYEPDRREYRIAADYELLVRFFRRHGMRAKYLKLYSTIMRTGGVSTKDVEARKKLNEEIIKANRVNGYFCCWPMLLPKYLVKIWEVILPRLGRM